MPRRNPDIASLESHLGFWLRYVSNQVSLGFRQKLAARGVSVAEWVLLRELHACGEAAPSVLAERIGMTRGGVTKLADRLVAKGLIRRRASDADGRAQILALAAAGRRLLPELAALADRNDAEYFGHLTASQRATIEGAMRDIVRRFSLRALPVE